MKRYRLGVISYLNSKPLVHYFEQHPHPALQLTYDIPSRLVKRLRDGELDVSLVSAITCLEDDTLSILPGVGIAAHGRVDSVRLFSKVEPMNVRRLALDTSSRTSVGLIRVLMGECFCNYPEYLSMPPDLPAMLAQADAGLLIGDPALCAYYGEAGRRGGLQTLDLGDLWNALTNLPFLFGVWAARRDADLGPVPALIREAREAGKPYLDAIADEAAVRMGLPAAVCRNYLRHTLVHDIGPREFDGLRRFRELAMRHGVIARDAPPFQIREEG